MASWRCCRARWCMDTMYVSSRAQVEAKWPHTALVSTRMEFMVAGLARRQRRCLQWKGGICGVGERDFGYHREVGAGGRDQVVLAAADCAANEEVVDGDGVDTALHLDEVGGGERGQNSNVPLEPAVPAQGDGQWGGAPVIGVEVALEDRHGGMDIVGAGEDAVHVEHHCPWGA